MNNHFFIGRNSKSKRLKNFIFSLVCALSTLFLTCKPKEEVLPEYVIIPDANFEKALISLKIDSIKDGKVLKQNVLKVTSLSLYYYGNSISVNDKIKSLSGIEAFVNLEKLYCPDHSLTSLDLTKNTVLKGLYCSNNQLTNLDVSENTMLTNLYCNNNQLVKLDVSKSTGMMELECYKNKLITFDISTGLTLRFLNLSYNQLVSLDVSKNTSLIVLDCSNNQLSNIIIGKNLRFLTIPNNQLSSLDISNNTAMESLRCYNNKIQFICLNRVHQVLDDWLIDPTTAFKVCP